MQTSFTVSALAAATGVTPKTIRYWERLGLLPQARRMHTGYRLFGPDAAQKVDFVQKAKSIGLTLAEIKRLLHLAHKGENPCPELMKWIDKKADAVEEQIRSIQNLRTRLRRFRRTCGKPSILTCFRPGELCCLIENLPKAKSKKGGRNA